MEQPIACVVMDHLITSLPLARFLAVLLAFVLPGYCWATWLHRADRFGRPVRCALGFAWSCAVFGLIGWPFLWYGFSFTAFLCCLYPAWALFALLGAVAYVRWRLSDEDRAPTTEDSGPNQARCRSSILDPRSSPPHRRAALALCLWLGLAAAVGCVWAGAEAWGRLAVICAAPLLLFGGYLAARRFRAACGSLLPFVPEDDQAAPRLWAAAAAVVILCQAASAILYDRPDWDDCFYQAAMLDYQQAQALNDQEPTHREGFPMPVIHRTLCWELWGAVVCHLSGLSPMALCHSFLPGILVLLAYAAYAGMLGEFLPRRWLPLALLGLSAYHLWGISGHATAANHFLPRLWQGKAVLLHIAVPLMALMLTRYTARPDWRRWLSLVACVGFGLAVSLSAVFMGVVLFACLVPALARTVRTGRVRIAVGAALAAAPLILAGLAVRALTQADGPIHSKPADMASWLLVLVRYMPLGSTELIWLFTLPLAAVLLGGGRRGAYLVAFPALLGITFANPLFYDLVAASVTSYYTYYRLWWLFPVGPGLAVLLALAVRFLARVWVPPAQRVPPLLPLSLAAAALVLSLGLPGIYVWGSRNSFIGPLGTPHRAQNLEKMPDDLLSVARLLLRDPEIRGKRILCDQQAASFLAPYARDFRFVQTRPMYTLYYFATAARPAEGLERHLLNVIRHHGRVPAQFDPLDWDELRFLDDDGAVRAMFGSPPRMPADLDVGALLARYHVAYVLTGPTDQPGPVFEENGYRVVKHQGPFVLWRKAARQYAGK